MPITTDDIKIYGSLNMPTGDGSTAGGAIDTTTRIVFDDATLAGTFGPHPVAFSSTVGGDNQNCTFYGRDAGGVIVSEQLTLNGTTPVTGVQSFSRILMIDFATSHAGTVGVRQGGGSFTPLAYMEAGVDTLRRPFYNVIADSDGGSQRVFYEKVFVKNNHGTLTLQDAGMSGGGPMATYTAFGIESGLNNSQSVTNRLTAPTGVSPYVNTAQNIYTSNLAAGSGQGVWLRLTLAAGQTPLNDIYSIQVTGNTI